MEVHSVLRRAKRFLDDMSALQVTPEQRVKSFVGALQSFSSVFAVLAKSATTRSWVDPGLEGIPSLYKSSARLNRATSTLKKSKVWAEEPLSPRAEAYLTKARLKFGVIDKDPKAVDLGAMEDVLVLIAKSLGTIRGTGDAVTNIIKAMAKMEKAFGRKWVYLVPKKSGNNPSLSDVKRGKAGTFWRVKGTR